jgi:hypothetical protein
LWSYDEAGSFWSLNGIESMEILRLIFLIFALLGCPALYVALIIRMRRAGVVHPPEFPFFFLFGTFGGWFLAIALSPSGLAALCSIFLGQLRLFHY